MILIRDRAVNGIIHISASSDEREQYAARELRYYFHLMTAKPVTILRSDTPVKDAAVVIGSALPLYGEARESYREDTLHYSVKDGRLYIDGGTRGLLYAVYEFLESIGCRFFTPQCEKVPTYVELDVPDTDRRADPAIELRDIYDLSVRNFRFALKCRINSEGAVPEALGGGVPIAMRGHTFCHLVPYSKYGKEHPEWFSLRGGSRDHDGLEDHRCQMCLTNPALMEKLIEETRRVLRAKPNARIMSLGQNDADDACECPACRAADAEEGSPSGLVLRTVNAVAEALEEEFPNVLFDTFAYNYTRFPPKKTKPRHNVAVRLCSIESCLSHPYTSCRAEMTENGPRRLRDDENSFADNLRAWHAICDHMCVWDYNTCFRYYPRPHPNWYAMQPNIRFFVENGVVDLFAQTNISGGGCDLEEMRVYLLSKLMWDPYCDVGAHMTEFTDFYYGDAGVFIREYVDTMCRKCAEDDIHVGCYAPIDPPYLSEEMLARYHEILDRAENAVRDDTIRRMRVCRVRLSLRFVKLRTEAKYDGIGDAEEFNRLIADFSAHGITRYEESRTRDKTIQGMVEQIRDGYMVPMNDYEGENPRGAYGY